MSDFIDQDLSGANFERVNMRSARFSQVRLNDSSMQQVDLTGVQIRGALLNGVQMVGVELCDVQISGELKNVVVNGVDIAPLIEIELNRRMPDRAKMRPDTVEGFQEAWALLHKLWETTILRARSLPVESLHRRVAAEWSFIETLRHLNFASAAWVGRMILGDPSPWHPLDLPWDEAPGWDGVPWDRDARPTLESVLAIREQRQAMVSGVIHALTAKQLASKLTRTEPGWPHLTDFPLKECLGIVLSEEWEHRLFAERDLSVLEATAS